MDVPVVQDVQKLLMESGVWLRPFGRLIYTMPPYIIDETQLEHLTSAIHAAIRQLSD